MPSLFPAPSVTGRFWHLKQADERRALALAQRLGVPDVVARLMAVRGIGLEEAPDYLSPKLKALLPSPRHLRDMDKAVARTVAAIQQQQPVAVFGDYDVDGATSTALLLRYFRAIGRPLAYYIPDRLREGYGPNVPAMSVLHGKGIRLLLTVDCGTTAFAPLEAAGKLGMDVVVLDHHLSDVVLPEATAVVNPNRQDEDSPCGNLAAVGVVFLFLIALTSTLEQEGFFQHVPRPDLLSMLDIVALGTVADVVPLTGVNRALVTQGLNVLASRHTLGLKALADVARLDEKPSAYHLGYIYGPRVNAGGRVGECDLGARLLATTDPAEAAALAVRLDGYNQERKVLEDVVLQEAMVQAERQHGSVLVVCGKDWHPGVIGIVAGRLKERFHRPACVVAFKDGVGKGSGRSISGIHLGNLILAARQQGLIEHGGGHGMAAGFTVAERTLPDFVAFLNDRASQTIVAENIVPTLNLDASLPLSAITPLLATSLEKLAPFGAGNPQPRFLLENVLLLQAQPIGANGAHLRLLLGTGRTGDAPVKAMAFRCGDSDLGQFLLEHRGRRFHLAGTVQRDTWGGNDRAQVFVDDVMGIDTLQRAQSDATILPAAVPGA